MNKIHIFKTEEDYLPVQMEHFSSNTSMLNERDRRERSKLQDYLKKRYPLAHDEVNGMRTLLGIPEDERRALHAGLAEGLEFRCLVRLDALNEQYYFQTEIDTPEGNTFDFARTLNELVAKVRINLATLSSSDSPYPGATITPVFYTIETAQDETKECGVNLGVLNGLLKELIPLPSHLLSVFAKSLAMDATDFISSRRGLSREERESFERLFYSL
ncbi:hypothetical protein J4219_04780 [Candidatus Woesearchaeota archaeon]|nr:hypothetical protein [Candidatus Woesearchaeota archaeon]